MWAGEERSLPSFCVNFVKQTNPLKSLLTKNFLCSSRGMSKGNTISRLKFTEVHRAVQFYVTEQYLDTFSPLLGMYTAKTKL